MAASTRETAETSAEISYMCRLHITACIVELDMRSYPRHSVADMS
jgi:hypothetical protein